MFTNLTRRSFCRDLVVGVASFAGISAGRAAETTAKRNSRELLLTASPDEAKPPVISALRVQPQGKLLAVAGDDHFVRLYDLSTGAQTHRLAGHKDWVRTLDFNTAGSELFSAGNDGRVLVWPSENPQDAVEFATGKQAIAAIRCAQQHPWLAVVGFESTVRLYDSATKKLLRELVGPSTDLRAVVFSPDDVLLAAAGRGGKINIWNAATGELVLESTPHRRVIQALAFSPDGKFLASAGDDRQIHLFPVSSESQGFYLPATTAKVRALTFISPHQLASGGSDNQIHVWDVHERRESDVWIGHRGTVIALEHGPQSLISASYDAVIRLWSAGDRVVQDNRPEVLRTVPRGETVR